LKMKSIREGNSVSSSRLVLIRWRRCLTIGWMMRARLRIRDWKARMERLVLRKFFVNLVFGGWFGERFFSGVAEAWGFIFMYKT
jgi:hypothetical protein